MRRCTVSSSRSRILRIAFSCSELKTTTLSSLFMNSGENLRRAASTPIFSKRALISCEAIAPGANPIGPSVTRLISRAPRFEVITMTQFEKSTRRLSPSVSVALSRMPNRSFQTPSKKMTFVLFDEGHFLGRGLEAVDVLLRKQWLGLAVPQIARGRTDQLRDFMRMLKLGAIDFDHRVRVAEENFGGD